MDLVRLNFSYGSYRLFSQWIEVIRESARELKRSVAIIQDLSGPKLRVGMIEDGSIELRSGDRFVLTRRPVQGSHQEVSVDYPGLTGEVNIGDTILLADGSIELLVKGKTDTDLICEVIIGGTLSSHKGINLPTIDTGSLVFTEKDRKDLEFGLQQGVDFIALSFVRRAQDIREVKEYMKTQGADIPVIAKIEKPQALDNIEEILQVADGIMIARGDLGVEIPLEKIPSIQKMLINKANEAAKPVITATQMLKSMVENIRPTRAEVTDVVNAIYEGSDALMLSEETAVGNYPIEAVRMMDRIAREAEKDLPYQELLTQKGYYKGDSIPEAISHAVCYLAQDLSVSAIITWTRSGRTARLIARYKPSQPIMALSPRADTVQRLTLSWGVYPFLVEELASLEEMIEKAEALSISYNLANKGERVVITGSLPLGGTGETNLIKAHVLSS